jgi:hypothetical protein
MRIGKLVVPVLLLTACAAGRADAQSGGQQGPPALRNVISANPFLLIATWFNAEYERAVSGGSTLGMRVSTLSLGIDTDTGNDDEADYYSGRAFYRYYPNGAFAGFFFGVDAGVTGLEESGETHTVMGAGFELGYNWLLGSRRNFYISIGAGADRLFGGELGDASAVIPTVRIVNIGFAF